MSEVRVHLAGYLAEGEHVVLQPDYDSLKFDFDRVTAERDALQSLLTAADELNDVQSWSLLEVVAACDLAMSAIDDDERGTNFVKIVAAIKAKALPKRSDELVAQHAAIDFFDAALKPADTAKCERCGCSTVETCDERGCGYLGAGNGAPE